MGDSHAARFPSPVYARHILGPAFEFAQAHLFGPMLAVARAHVVMLAECGLLDHDRAVLLLAAIADAETAGPGAYRYDPAVEDLYFAIEARFAEQCGKDVAGSLALARSRNDLDGAVARLALRERLLALVELAIAIRERLLGLAREHLRTLMPGVTHTQEAQPTTLAHYLMGVLGPLARDGERLRLAYRHTNQSPLGVAAFTTTGVPIDRERTRELLGFDGLVENGYDAVGAADYMLETVATLRTLCASLVRFVNDLLIWGRSEVGIVRIGDEFIQISSIMPQKRNPVVLEHLRARIGYVFGDAATVEALAHGAAFGDTVDVEDEIYVPLFRCCASAAGVLELLAAVLATVSFDRDKMRERALTGFGTATELADRLAVDGGLGYRQAHAVVTRLVGSLRAAGQDLRALDAAQVESAVQAVAGRHVEVTTELLASSLNAELFVARRTLPGGPAPAAVTAAIQREEEQRLALAGWLAERRSALVGAHQRLTQRASELLTMADPLDD